MSMLSWNSSVFRAPFPSMYCMLRTSSSSAYTVKMDNVEKIRMGRVGMVKAVPGQATIGFIGTGVMGCSMCKHIIRKGYNVRVYNRTVSKCEPLVEMGAVLCKSYAEVGSNSDIVITIVGYPEDVKQAYLGDGVLKTLRVGGIVIDMTTSSPATAKILADVARDKGIFALDAPVTGGDVGAREGKLSVMVGGEEEGFKAAIPLFETFASTITYAGPPGSGQHTKMVNQILISTTMIGVVEALMYAKRMGLDLEKTLAAVSSGSAGSWSLSNYAPRMLKGDYEPGFYVEHFLKDMEIALQEARGQSLSLPGLALAHELYTSVKALGYGRKGIQALQLALENMNNMRSGNIGLFSKR